jgi:hypothetical protein
VVGEAVVEQRHLGADAPGREQVHDVGRARWQPQADRAAWPQTRGGQLRGAGDDQGAQGGARQGLRELQAHVAVAAGEQIPVDPVSIVHGRSSVPHRPGLVGAER